MVDKDMVIINFLFNLINHDTLNLTFNNFSYV